MSSFWTPTISPVQTGEPVSAPVANRPINQLDARDRFLFDQIRSLNQKSGRLVSAGVPLGGGAVAGSVVFYNADSGNYEPALARDAYSAADGRQHTAPSAAAAVRTHP